MKIVLFVTLLLFMTFSFIGCSKDLARNNPFDPQNPNNTNTTVTTNNSTLNTPILILPVNNSIFGDKRPTFDWNDVTGAIEYVIQIDDNTQFINPKVNNVVNISNYISSVDLNDNKYYWRIKAKNSKGVESQWSSIWNFSIAPYLTYPTPGTYPTGIAWDGFNIWSCDSVANRIYKHNMDSTLSVIASCSGDYPQGLTWDGATLYAGSFGYSPSRINCYNNNLIKQGYDEIPDISDGLSGIVWANGKMWVSEYTTNRIWRLFLGGTPNEWLTETSWASPGSLPRGITWDGAYIWTCDYNNNKIYKQTITGFIIVTYDSPPQTTGLAWDGQFIWSCSSSTGKFYKYLRW